MDDVRSRVRSHLTALSAASLLLACNHRACGKTDGAGGYGVVDPLPAPSCLDKGTPTATAVFVMYEPEDAGAPLDAGATPTSKAKPKDAGPPRPRPLRRGVRIAVRLNIEGATVTSVSGGKRGEIIEQTPTPDGVSIFVAVKDEPAAKQPCEKVVLPGGSMTYRGDCGEEPYPHVDNELAIGIGVSCAIGPSSFFVKVPLDPDGGEATATVSRW